MKVTLLFPPGTDPRSPHLALPYLAAVVRKAGLEAEILDLDLDGMLALMQPSNLAQARERVVKKIPSAFGAERKNLRRLVALADLLPSRIGDALATLRDPVDFYDSNRFNAARETIFSCLDLISAAARSPVSYNISPIHYDVAGIDAQSLADLIAVTADRDANLFADYWETDLYPRLENQRPDLIGITITNRQQIIPGLTLARQLRSRGHFVVLGGTVYTKFADKLARLPAFFEHFADGVVVYEGETALVELMHQLQAGRDYSKVPNYLYYSRGEVRRTVTHIEDVNALPAPDFTGLPLEKYLTPEPVLPVLLGKGCYFNRCKFCDIPFINHVAKKAYRIRAPELVVGDLIELQRRFGCRHFELTDEALPPKLLEELADALQPHRERRFAFVGYARLEPAFTPEFCATLATMGVKKLFFGLESAAQETLDHMDKGIQVSDVPTVLRNCRDAGIRFHLFSIVGFPEETEESALKTWQFFEDNVAVINHPGNSFDIHPFGLELRTRYSEEAVPMGLVIDPAALTKDFVIGVGDQWTNTRGLTRERAETLLSEFAAQLRRKYREYHASPQHLWPGFEEFAVLYADRYGDGEFPFRTALPPDDDQRLYRVRWNSAALIEKLAGDMVRISSRYGEVRVDQRAFALLDCKAYQPIRRLLEELSTAYPSDWLSGTSVLGRQTLDNLMEKGLLMLEPLPRSKGVSASADLRLATVTC